MKKLNSNTNEEGVEDIDCNELADNQSDIRIVDVRGADEYVGELGHIEGAELMPLEASFPEDVKALSSEDRPIVFICRSGVRSIKAAQIAAQCGIANVYNLAGGMTAWSELKKPVER